MPEPIIEPATRVTESNSESPGFSCSEKGGFGNGRHCERIVAVTGTRLHLSTESRVHK